MTSLIDIESKIRNQKSEIRKILAELKNTDDADNKLKLLKQIHCPDLPKELISYILNMDSSKRYLNIIFKQNLKLGDEIKSLVGDYSHCENWLYQRPKREYYDIFKAPCEKYFQNSINAKIANIDTKKSYNSAQVKALVKEIVDDILTTYPNFKNWNFTYELGSQYKFYGPKRMIMIARRDISSTSLKRIIYHEIFTHLLRYINAVNNKVIPRLPGYLNFEEGLAIITEQILTHKLVIQRKSRIIPLLIILSYLGLSRIKIENCVQLLRENVFFRSGILDNFVASNLNQKYQLPTVNNIHSYKPLAYTVGFVKINYLLNTYFDTDQSIELKSALLKIFNQIYEAKFDPYDKDHIDYIIYKNILSFNPSEYDSYIAFLAHKKTEYIISMTKNINLR